MTDKVRNTMKRSDLKHLVTQLAEDFNLRWIEKAKRYVGLHRGIIVDISEWDGEVSFTFNTLTADLGEQILADFAGFKHLRDAGIPQSCIRGLMQHDERGDEVSCDTAVGITIDTQSVDQVGVETFKQLPDLAADDLHAHGATTALTCPQCQAKEATTVGLMNYATVPICEDCLLNLQLNAWDGKLKVDHRVNWFAAIPVLLVATALGGWLWGYLQQPQRMDGIGYLGMLLPAGWAFGLCCLIFRVSGGVNRMLRISLFASVIISVLAGNIWGFRSFAVQHIHKQIDSTYVGPDWQASIRLYFEMLPQIWQNESTFLIGGLLGAWIGLRMLKSEESVDLQ